MAPANHMSTKIMKALPVKKNTRTPKTKRAPIRKAPGAPKRFLSSYILFYIDYQKRIKNSIANTQDGKHDCIAVSKKATEVWKTLTPAQRQYWDRKSEEDKQRFFSEKDQYEGPWEPRTGDKRKKATRDPSAPKRNPSAFLLFSKNRRTELRLENPQIANNVISVLLGQEWRNMSLEEKMPFKEDEERERAIYKQRMAQWRALKAENAAAANQLLLDDMSHDDVNLADIFLDNVQFPDMNLADIVMSDEESEEDDDDDEKRFIDQVDRMLKKNVANNAIDEGIASDLLMDDHRTIINIPEHTYSACTSTETSESGDELYLLETSSSREDYFLHDPLLPILNNTSRSGSGTQQYQHYNQQDQDHQRMKMNMNASISPPPLKWPTSRRPIRVVMNTVRLPSFLQREYRSFT